MVITTSGGRDIQDKPTSIGDFLKRSANDFITFSLKTPAANDIIIIEDTDGGGVKKHVTVASLAGGGSFLLRTANDFNTFTQVTSLQGTDVFILEDASDSGNKKYVVAGDAFLLRTANDFNTYTEKSVTADDDIVLIEDSAASGVKKYVKLSNLIGSAPITFSDIIALDSVISPAALTVNTNNYNPTDIDKANMLRISSTTNVDLTGIEQPITNPATSSPYNQLLFVINIGTNNIILKDDSASSDAENRFLLGANKTIQSDEGVLLVYDRDSLRWRAAAIQI